MRTLLCFALLCAGSLWAQEAGEPIPQLRKQGAATQLLVDGKPFLMLAGELHNSSASSLDYMQPIWPKLADLHLNTALATVSWELVEPEEGKYDFTLVDGLIRQAREHRMRLVFLWFGSWKNGVSSYAPLWVKTDLKRFPRMHKKDGENIEVLSPLADASRDADARAFAALMRHIREVDSRERTVVMMQVENEVGLLGDSRDRSPLASAAWAKPVPAELMAYLQNNKAALLPELREIWEAAGAKTSGTWAEVFGTSPLADEVFMAWHMGRYVGTVAAKGKAEYPLPMYANAWLVQNEKQLPGGYPSGGPVSRVMDVWRAAAPKIDLLAPDIYLPDFKGVCASYARSGNPLFIPEANRAPISAANVFYAIGQHDAMGFAPFGIDSIEGPHPLKQSYELLAGLAPLIAKHNGNGSMRGILEDKENAETMELGGYRLRVSFARRPGAAPDSKGYGIAIATGRDEFLFAGSGFTVTFEASSPGPKLARIGIIDEGRYIEGKWVPGRRINGDENGGGTRLQLPPGRLSLQKIRLYRHD